MGSLFDDEDDDEEFDLAKIEARHERMEAEALLDEEEKRLAEQIAQEQAQEVSEIPEEEGEVEEEPEEIPGIYPASRLGGDRGSGAVHDGQFGSGGTACDGD